MPSLLNEIKALEPEYIQMIHQRFGIVIHINQAPDLVKTISEACMQYSCSPQEYLKQLKQSPSSSELVSELVAAITVGESYFFRDTHQMELLENSILPNLIREKQEKRALKIWSAGCAAGEEIYTIAMLLRELIPDISHWDLQLLGSDINTTALQKAVSGSYGQWSMRSISEAYIQRYFVKSGRRYILSSEVRNMVKFKYLNLCDNSYPSLINGINQIDLILCRNVLIYFDNELVAKIMKKLSMCMAEEGYLLLGASDPIITKETNLIFHHNGAIYFSLDTNNSNYLDASDKPRHVGGGD